MLQITQENKNRTNAYLAIDGERAYQEDIHPHPEPLTVGEELILLEEYIAKAREKWVKEGRPEVATLNGIRKVAAIAVRCLEQHGAPRRDGY